MGGERGGKPPIRGRLDSCIVPALVSSSIHPFVIHPHAYLAPPPGRRAGQQADKQTKSARHPAELNKYLQKERVKDEYRAAPSLSSPLFEATRILPWLSTGRLSREPAEGLTPGENLFPSTQRLRMAANSQVTKGLTSLAVH